jgi:hypothetical protein
VCCLETVSRMIWSLLFSGQAWMKVQCVCVHTIHAAAGTGNTMSELYTHVCSAEPQVTATYMRVFTMGCDVHVLLLAGSSVCRCRGWIGVSWHSSWWLVPHWTKHKQMLW